MPNNIDNLYYSSPHGFVFIESNAKYPAIIYNAFTEQMKMMCSKEEYIENFEKVHPQSELHFAYLQEQITQLRSFVQSRLK